MFFRFGLLPRAPSAVIFLLVSSVARTHSEKSLFDELPLNGALDPSASSYSTSQSNHRPGTTYPTPANRYRSHYQKADTTEKASLFDSLPDHGALSPNVNKIRNPRDSVDFDVTRVAPSNEFDVNSWDSRLLPPIVNFIARPPPRGPPPRVQNNRHPPYPPPPPPGMRIGYVPPSRTDSYYNHHQPSTLPTREEITSTHNKSVNHVSANSGGPTVIVYAHPNNKGSQPGYTDRPKEHLTQNDASEQKNEIHYHYHINENKNEEVKPSSGGYSGGGYRPEPPRYGGPTRTKPSHAYGPPPMRGRPYQESRYNLRQNEGSSFTNSNSQTEDHLKDEDDFSRRTFVTPSRPSSSYRPADTVSFLKPSQPSTSYEVPPSFNAPSSSYNSPSNQYGPPVSPEPSYGPPTAPPTGPPAPPPPSSDQAGGDQFETTITLQTIPITRQVTELVQVPNVVHKISSNRPSVSEQNFQADEPVNHPPSSSYGPPAPPSRQNIPQSPRGSTRGSERPFDSHLAQILGVGPTQNPKDAVLQELLLGQARNPGMDLTLSDLEVFSLLQGSRGNSLGGSRTPILAPGRNNLFGGLFGGSGSSRLAGGNSLSSALFQPRDQGLSSDGLGSLREAFREQRFQLALADIRKQLKEQNRDNVRERSTYGSLFSKGALLLSALTLLPSFINPMASAAGVTAANSAIPNFMLPVTGTGRRKRSIPEMEKNPHSHKTAFETCLEDASKSGDSVAYEKWLACSTNLTTSFPREAETEVTRTQTFPVTTKTAFQDVVWNGVLLPKLIQSDLKKYIPPKDLAKASKCMQRDLCKTIQEIEKLPNKRSLFLDLVTARNVEKNRWISESLTAAGDSDCDRFNCKYT